jgi:ribosome-binding factor A
MNHQLKNFTRRDQLDKQLAKEVAELIRAHFPIKKFGLISVTGVKVAGGFDSAKIGVSVMRNSHQFNDVAKTVIHKIQADLNRKLVMKKIPKIILELDRTTGLIEKIEQLEN